MHYAAYLRSAEEIISTYDGSLPLAAWLKAHFRQHKKFGSKDRRWVSDLCFCFFRLGHALATQPVADRLLLGQLFCHNASPVVAALKPEWAALSSLSLAEKLQALGVQEARDFFPLLHEVSSEIDAESFALSHLHQPDLFLRIRPGRREGVLQKLQEAGLSFSVEDDCVRLPNNSKIDEVLALDAEVVVQDKNSQRVLELLESEIRNQKSEISAAWDCCAASGGKSILLHDRFPQVQLTVSDVRESILHNLRSRFKRAGIMAYDAFVADVSSPSFKPRKTFDLVVCDAPCSGSGTWGRTPEQLIFFKQEKIAHYTGLQKAIAVNASKAVKDGGAFLYITCSVFREENEAVVDFLQQETRLQLKDSRYFKGYTDRADTLFAALFRL